MVYENQDIEDLFKIYLDCKSEFEKPLLQLEFEELYDRFFETYFKNQESNFMDQKIPKHIKEIIKEHIIKIISENLTDLLLLNQFFPKETLNSLLNYIGLNFNTKIKKDFDESEEFYKIYLKYDQKFKEKFVFILRSNEIHEISLYNKNKVIKNPIPLQIFSQLAEKLQYAEKKINQPDSGTFFTPEIDITLICRQALMYQFTEENGQCDSKTIEKLLGLMNGDIYTEGSVLEKRRIQKIFQDISILDPACGTGKFLIIMADILYNLVKGLQLDSNETDYNILTNLFAKLKGIEISPTIAFKTRIVLFMHFYQKLLKETDPRDIINPKYVIDNDTLSSIVHIGDFLWNDTLRNPIKSQQFQIILGNPPFVRQENIKPTGISLLRLLSESDRDINVNYKNKIQSQIYSIFRNDQNYILPGFFNKRSDLYIYFFYNAFNYLNKNGIIAFISSNSWLNIGFGFDFQKFILDKKSLLSIVGNYKRTFGSVKINTITTYLANSSKIVDPLISFINLKKLNSIPDIDKIIIQTHDNATNNEESTSKISEFNSELLQIRQINCNNLLRIGSVSSNYLGSRWENLFLLSPSFYFKLIPQIGDKLLRLGDIAQIYRGITTGINKFFIMKKVKEDNKEGVLSLENGFGYRYDIERDFLRPIVTTPKTIHKPVIKEEEIQEFLFYINENQQKSLNKTLAEKYIKYGEELKIPLPKGKNKSEIIIGMNNIPSLLNKNKWYSIKIPRNFEKTDLFIQKIFDRSYKWCSIKSNQKDSRILALNNFYYVILRPEYKKHINIIELSLISSLLALSIELNARRTFGSGALDTATFDIENILVLNPNRLSDSELQKLMDLHEIEINLEFKPFNDAIKNNKRILLDELIFGYLKIIDSKTDLDQLYNSISDIISIRLNKVKSQKI